MCSHLDRLRGYGVDSVHEVEHGQADADDGWGHGGDEADERVCRIGPLLIGYTLRK